MGGLFASRPSRFESRGRELHKSAALNNDIMFPYITPRGAPCVLEYKEVSNLT